MILIVPSSPPHYIYIYIWLSAFSLCPEVGCGKACAGLMPGACAAPPRCQTAVLMGQQLNIVTPLRDSEENDPQTGKVVTAST